MEEKILLKFLLQNRKIDIEEIQQFLGCNKEEMIEILIDFINMELSSFEEEEENIYPKYLFYAKKQIEILHSKLLYEGKARLPFYKDYLSLEERLISISKKYKIEEKNENEIFQEFICDLFFYTNIDAVKEKLDKYPYFIQKISKIKELYSLLSNNFYNSFFGSMEEYNYYKELMKYILQNKNIDPDLKLKIIKDYQNEADEIYQILNGDYINYRYRYREINLIFGSCRKDILAYLKNYKSGMKKQMKTKFRFLKNYKVEIKKESKIKSNPFIFTIDNPETILREDAISVIEKRNHIKITVYITNVAQSVMKNDTLFKETYKNWFEEINDGIFDINYASEYFSLDEGKMRDVYAYEYDFDEKNMLKKLTIYPTNIIVDQNYTYDKVNNILLDESHKKTHKKEFDTILKICMNLHKNNFQKKKYHMLKEIDRAIDNNFDSKKYRNHAGIIISELKIMSGYVLAKYFLDKKVPAIYRNNEFTVSDKEMENIKNICNQSDDPRTLKNQIQKTGIESYYSYQNHGHKGLDLPCYMHITTPSRNYFSLVNSIIFQDIFLNENKEKIEFYEELVQDLTILQEDKDRYRKKIYELRNKNL